MIKKICVKADNFVILYETNCSDSMVFLENNIEDLTKHSINFSILESISAFDASIIYTDTSEYGLYLDKKKKELYLSKNKPNSLVSV